MKIKHLIAEAFRGLRTAKISTITTIFTITLSLVLIIIFVTLSVNSGKLIKSVKEKVEIEVFLSEDISNDETNDLREKIRTIGGVKNITYISKNEAAKIFEAEFGKEMLEVFESNPLPASLRINLYDEYKSIERMNKIKNLISTYPKVDDIIFPEKYLEVIEKNSSVILTINLISLIIISLSSVFLVSNTIRLVISSRKKLINLLKLLGAKNSFIVTPFIIEGFILGIIGAIFAGIIIFGLNYYISSKFFENELKISILNYENLIFTAVAGIFLGIFGSLITVRRFLKKEKAVI
ncbi:MAG: FtsX-like permease family protein [Ignavibacteria bacterium]|nr:FtsX-like permease family protein [Ignavibacteria bacterium]